LCQPRGFLSGLDLERVETFRVRLAQIEAQFGCQFDAMSSMLQGLDQHPCHLAVAGDNGIIGRLQRLVEGNSHRRILSSESRRKAISQHKRLRLRAMRRATTY